MFHILAEASRNGEGAINGGIIGGVALVVVAIAIIATVIICYCRRSGNLTDDTQIIYRDQNISLEDLPGDAAMKNN